MKKKNLQGKAAEFVAFRFTTILGLSPRVYIPVFYGLIIILGIYFLFLNQGLRNPQARIYLQVLAGESSLYIDGKFVRNLLHSPQKAVTSVLIPAGVHRLRIEKAGMLPWVREQNFPAGIWNNYWSPTSYHIPVQLSKNLAEDSSGDRYYLWHEAWRSYLYRGLEGQKAISFDASHPYPWVLSEGLRAVFYSQETSGVTHIPSYWSGDVQRGLASTTNTYQWGDLLSAFSLLGQFEGGLTEPGSSRKAPDLGGRIGLLGPRSLSKMARSGAKRLRRLQPHAQSLIAGGELWDDQQKVPSGLRELRKLLQEFAQAPQLFREDRRQVPSRAEPERLKKLGQVALKFDDFGFIAVPGLNFSVQQHEVSNVQFARFWFSVAGEKWREQQAKEAAERRKQGLLSVVETLRYSEDAQELPWDWPDQFPGGLDPEQAISELLGDRPVRGITWQEAQAFAQWLNRQQRVPKGWHFSLPTKAQYEQLLQVLQDFGEVSGGGTAGELNFRIPESPPIFSAVTENFLGIQGLGGSLWEWLDADYLPYAVSNSANSAGNLHYKVLAGGSWLNALPIQEETEELWGDEFLLQGKELPIEADYQTLAGQFSILRSPYTGLRLIAYPELNDKDQNQG